MRAFFGMVSSGLSVVYRFFLHHFKKLLAVERMVISVLRLNGLLRELRCRSFFKQRFLNDISIAFCKSPSVSSSMRRFPMTGRR